MKAEVAEIFKLNTHFLKPPCSSFLFFLLLENLRVPSWWKGNKKMEGDRFTRLESGEAEEDTLTHTGYDVNGKDTFTVLSHWDFEGCLL